MLLNNFLYNRSLIQNEQYHYRTSFSSLIPKTRINEDLNGPLNEEEYQEEIKKIRVVLNFFSLVLLFYVWP